MLKLPKIPQRELMVQPINWGALPKRYMNPGELEVLVALVLMVEARNVLEIGVNEGRTAKAILSNVPHLEHYQGIDVLPGYRFNCAVQSNEVPNQAGKFALEDPRFELIVRPRGSFDVTAEQLLPCDVAFIDGDHSAKAVKHDTELAGALVRRGGLIVWHDYHDLGTVDVRDVLHQMHDEGVKLQHVEDTWLVFERL